MMLDMASLLCMPWMVFTGSINTKLTIAVHASAADAVHFKSRCGRALSDYLQGVSKGSYSVAGSVWARIHAGQGAHDLSLGVHQKSSEAWVHRDDPVCSPQGCLEGPDPSHTRLEAAATPASAA